MTLIVLKYSKQGVFNKYDSLELYHAIVSVYNQYDIIELKLINSKCSIEFIKYLFYLLWRDFGVDEIMSKIKIFDEKILSKIEVIGSVYA